LRSNAGFRSLPSIISGTRSRKPENSERLKYGSNFPFAPIELPGVQTVERQSAIVEPELLRVIEMQTHTVESSMISALMLAGALPLEAEMQTGAVVLVSRIPNPFSSNCRVMESTA
jgi:hypothetical protein